ncbi:hypothetical protein Tco_0442198 [Tanacetum coccineum]
MKNGRDLVARAFHALGLLTVVIGNVLVSVLFGDDSERVKGRSSSAEFCPDRVKLVEGVKEMEMKVKRFSDGVDALNNGVNGLFRTVLKTRNGRLDVKF